MRARNYITSSASARRPGISLLEVLICIGVVAIGLVSIAALIPVGGLQVQRANTEERKGTLGLNAFREFQIRGMGTIPTLPDPAGLTAPQIAAIQNQGPWCTAGGSPFFTVASGQWQAYTNPPLAIDPLMVSIAGSTVDHFPANSPSGAPTLKRLSLASVYNATPSTYQSLAAAIFTAADDVVANIPDDNSQIGTSVLDSTGNKRDFNGSFTWLATIAPYYPGSSSMDSSQMNQYQLSVVVFDRRILSTPVAANIDSGQEEIVQAVSATPATNSVGGGEFTFVDSSSNASAKLSMVRPEQWLMLTRYLPYTPNNPPWIEAKWYRIVAVSDIAQSGSIFSRQVTLDGADWAADPTAANTANPSASYIAPANVAWGSVPVGFQNYNTYACLFDGAVGVFQKVIHLEGPSNWSQ